MIGIISGFCLWLVIWDRLLVVGVSWWFLLYQSWFGLIIRRDAVSTRWFFYGCLMSCTVSGRLFVFVFIGMVIVGGVVRLVGNVNTKFLFMIGW